MGLPGGRRPGGDVVGLGVEGGPGEHPGADDVVLDPDHLVMLEQRDVLVGGGVEDDGRAVLGEHLARRAVGQADILAFYAFPSSHWRKRANCEITRVRDFF